MSDLPNKDEEPCPRCVTNVAMGFLLKICKESLSDKLDCKDLGERFLRGEISEEQLAKQIKKVARDDSALMEDIEEIDRIRKTKKIEP